MERLRHPLAVALLSASTMMLVFAFSGRGGPAFMPCLVPFLTWPFGAAWLAAQVAYCYACDAREGLVWVAVVALLAAFALWVGLAFRPSFSLAVRGIDRVVTGAALTSGLVLGWAVMRGRV